VPRCSACKKQGEPCNITDYVAYSYALVERLHSRIQELESKLDSQASNNNISDQPPNAPVRLDPAAYPRETDVPEKLPWSADVSKEAEEVGVLAIGFDDRYSQNKYCKSTATSFLFNQLRQPPQWARPLDRPLLASSSSKWAWIPRQNRITANWNRKMIRQTIQRQSPRGPSLVAVHASGIYSIVLSTHIPSSAGVQWL
jgi:hypothetical protein